MSLRIFRYSKSLFKFNQNFLNANLKLSNCCRDILPFEKIPVVTPPIVEPEFLSTFHQYLEETHKKLGPIFVEKSHRDIVFIADPESNMKIFENEGTYPIHPLLTSWIYYLEDHGKSRGLFFTDGEEWYKNRSAFNRVMLRQNAMEDQVQKVSFVCKNLMDTWRINPPSDLIYPLYSWTSECVGAILLGRNLGFLQTLKYKKANRQGTDEARFVTALLEIFETTAQLVPFDASLANSSKNQSWMAFYEAANAAFSYGESVIQKSIQNCASGLHSENIGESILYKVLNEQKLNEETIKNVIIDIILTSVDTTSHTALWALYLLGRNPEIANKAREEIFSVLKSEKTLTFKTLGKLSCIRGIIKETLRLYPSAASVIRQMAHDAELCNYRIPAGTIVSSSLITMGRNPNNFTFPDEFRPERWLSKRDKPDMYINHNSKANTPFAFGKRSCMGKRVADLSLSLLLIEALSTFEWTVEEEVDIVMKLITVPSDDIKMKFTLL